jgi:hypothetical protein
MDTSVLQNLGQYSSIGTLIAVLGLAVHKCLKHSKCRSRCCGGAETTISVDLEENLTPKKEASVQQ